MATRSAVDNVVSLPGSPARGHRRAVKPESVGVINDCRDIALKRIVALLATTFDTIEDELFEMAEKAPDRESQNLYLDARAQAREKRGDIEAAFRRQFLSCFEKKVAGEDELARAPVDYGAMELALVDDDDLEQKLAVSELAKRMSDKCDGELRALSQRMGFLLSEPELKDEANPIAPDTIMKALEVACDQMTSGFQGKLAVLKLVEQHLANEMLAVYRDINSHLVQRQILPQIRPSYRVPQGAAPRKAPPAAAAPATGATAPDAAPAQDIFAQLQQLMAGNAMFDPALAAGSAAPPAHGVTTGSFAPAPPPLHPEAAAEALRRIAQGAPAAAPLMTTLTTLQGVAPAPAFVPGETPAAVLNMLRELKTPEVVQSSAPIDVLTIDIVAMLFDYIFDDRAIPESIKGLIARLQIPALKVALLDRSFFSKKTHPARRLLDALADASVCFAGVADPADPLYCKIEYVVDRVHGEFETDIQIFTDVLADLEAFLAEREAANAEWVEQSARAVHEREKREMARLIAVDETDRRTAAGDLPGPVAAVLRGPWARVLERTYLREGGRNAGFAHALETADNLVWSVMPKSGAEERKRLVAMLPGLLKSLQQGMEVAAVEPADRARFFAALVDCHAAAVKAGLRGESVAALLAQATHNTDTGPLFAKLIDEEKAREAAAAAARSGMARIQFTDHGVEIEEVRATVAESRVAPTRPGEAAPAEVPPPAAHADMKRGTWVEFRRAGRRPARVKLSWVSPLRGIYLFTGAGSGEAFSIEPAALDAQIARGDARVIDESSLMDRAVDNLVHSLSKAAHA